MLKFETSQTTKGFICKKFKQLKIRYSSVIMNLVVFQKVTSGEWYQLQNYQNLEPKISHI